MALLNRLGTIGATRKICLDLPCLVNAETTMARLSDGLGNRGRLILREGPSLPRRSAMYRVEHHHVVSIEENEHYRCDILDARGCVWLALEQSQTSSDSKQFVTI
jgi:hypothetical protein